MKTIVLLIFLFCQVLLSFGQSFEFKLHEINTFLDRMGQTDLVDVDNDGDLDWVFGRFGDMYWYEYKSADNWYLHEIGTGATTDVGGTSIDINGDGWIDFVAGDSWYENTGRPRGERFILHKKNMISSHDNIVADIDGDDIKDIISLSNHQDHPVLAWYRIPEDHTQNWNYHKIGRGIHGGIDPAGFGDLDQDGDTDIVKGNIWYENPGNERTRWTAHEILIPPGGNRPDKFGLATKTWCIDLDNDGDLDVIEAEADTENGRVFWFENNNKGKSFTFHPISADTTHQDFHSLAVADFDGDGDVDVLSGGGPLSQRDFQLLMWENSSGNGSTWIEHLILEGKRIHEAVAADVDQDGDIDICAKPWRGGLHIYLENKLVK